MPSLIRLTALALARALLAGAPTEDGLAARLRVCLDADAVWVAPLAERCSRIGREHWRRLTPRTLAKWIERDPGYLQAWSAMPLGLTFLRGRTTQASTRGRSRSRTRAATSCANASA